MRSRTAASSTAELVQALEPLTALGLSHEEALVLGMGRFPVAGLTTWIDDFHAARYNPTPHLHQGNDLFADLGAPVRSPADGVIRFAEEMVAGKSIYVTTSDGTFYYMTHLDGFAPGLSTGDRVGVGDTVGTNGATGNAAGGPPHVHISIHPFGGAAVDPKPILDRWVAEAVAVAPSLIAARGGANPRVLLATGELRRFDVVSSSTPERAAKGPLLWSATVTAAGAAYRLGEVAAVRVAQRVDWTSRAVRAREKAAVSLEAQRRAVSVLGRLTPPDLRPMLHPGSA